jgi:hypothetical protein
MYKVIDGLLARNEGVDRMQVGETYAQALLGLWVLDTQWDDDLAGVARERDLAPDVIAVVSAGRQDQEHCPAAFDRLGDLAFARPARDQVPCRDPTGHTAALELANDLDGCRALFASMADEEEHAGRSHTTAP